VRFLADFSIFPEKEGKSGVLDCSAVTNTPDRKFEQNYPVNFFVHPGLNWRNIYIPDGKYLKFQVTINIHTLPAVQPCEKTG
jgi:hypothetical protein